MEMELDPKIINYEHILTIMPRNEFSLLNKGLAEMKKFGVGDFAYRSITCTGESNIFSTSLGWHEINKDPKFLKYMAHHMNAEMLHVKQNNLKFFTRSDDRTNTPYLQYLERHGVNNSVVNSKFDPDKMELFYFVTKSDRLECRDIILNNLDELNQIIDRMSPIFKFFNESYEFQSNKKQLLDDSTTKSLWQNNFIKLAQQGKFTRILFQGKEIFVSKSLLNCLLLLGLGWSNKSIAIKLDLSELTIKDHVAKLKKIFSIQSRDYFTELMQSGELRYLNRLRKAI